MTNPIIKIHNVTTGEIIEREMNAEELAQRAKDHSIRQALIEEKAEAETKKQALLDRLGITSEEARLLLS
jgi:hypothetical protein